MGKIRADVYERAAELISEGAQKYSCHAIEQAAREIYKKENSRRYHERAEDHSEKYWRYFAPRTPDGRFDFASLTKHPFWNKEATKLRQNNRIQALLMMAAIAASDPNFSIKHN